MKVSTTIPNLDEILDGGIEDGSSVLILADMSIDKTRFGVNILSERLNEGDNGVYFVNSRLPHLVKEEIRNLEKFKDNASLIDGLSYSLEKLSDGDFQIKERTANTKKYEEETERIIKEVLEQRGYGTTMIVDALDFLVGDFESIKQMVQNLKEKLLDTHTISYYLLSDVGFSYYTSGEVGFKDEDIEKFSRIFDYIIRLKALERRGLTIEYIDVEMPKLEEKIPFVMTPSGISIYVPKILVTGPYNAGKSTTIQALSQKAVSVDVLGTTVCLDHGYVERKGFSVDLFGTPGQEKFDWILDMLSKTIFGVILVVDSTKPETFSRAKEMLEKVRHRIIPVGVMANKQDLPDALSPADIEKEIGFKTIGTTATTGEGCDEVLEDLFQEILKKELWMEYLRKSA